ncbi:MAG: fumarylacetoacetate hydrolase family protein [Trueperaceae bacterium]|nr:fumarylacetoacetate hydrolase family protein [Trueperaceae bacterium]
MIKLSKHKRTDGDRWAVNGEWLPENFSLASLLTMTKSEIGGYFKTRAASSSQLSEPSVAPIDAMQEVWASGVTYLRSRDARKAESEVADVYERVYDAERPELFFKALGWRTVGPDGIIRIRQDSDWNVPEPELCLVINSQMEIVGFTVGNDVSSRSIEGENPLYLPQAKSYDGACALGPEICLVDDVTELEALDIDLSISRSGQEVFSAQTSTSQMKRKFTELASYLGRELSFPQGVLLMTGTGIVPGDEFSLASGDEVKIKIAELTLTNTVA